MVEPPIGGSDAGTDQVIFFNGSDGVVLGQNGNNDEAWTIWRTSDDGTHWTAVVPRNALNGGWPLIQSGSLRGCRTFARAAAPSTSRRPAPRRAAPGPRKTVSHGAMLSNHGSGPEVAENGPCLATNGMWFCVPECGVLFQHVVPAIPGSARRHLSRRCRRYRHGYRCELERCTELR